MLFFLAIFAVFVGSIPRILHFFLKPLSKVPSLDPMSITKDFLFKEYCFIKSELN